MKAIDRAIVALNETVKKTNAKLADSIDRDLETFDGRHAWAPDHDRERWKRTANDKAARLRQLS